MGSLMHAIDRFLRRLTEAVGVVGVAAICGLMVLTVITVVLRALHIAFPGSYSIIELLLVPAVSISVAYAAYANEHTRAALFVDRIKNIRLRYAINGVMLILGSLFWVIVIYATAKEAIRRGKQNELSPIIDVPVAPFRWSMAVALSLVVVVLLWHGYKLLRGYPAGGEAEENPYATPEESQQ